MKRLYIIWLAIFFVSFGVKAQDGEALKKIESARIALITERLDLTPEQAEKFWPVYREYSEKRRELRQELRGARQDVNLEELSEEETEELIAKALELKQKQLDLEKEYAEKMKNVISTQQLMKLKTAENDFQQMILRRLQNQRQNQGAQREKLMQRKEMLKERGNN